MTSLTRWPISVFRRLFLVTSTTVSVALGAPPIGAAPLDSQATAPEILRESGVQGGFVVHVGCGDGVRTGALRANASFQVHGLDRSAANVAKARKHIRGLSAHGSGVYGEVAIERWRGKHLPYVDNLVNLLVVEDPAEVTMSEALRVLVPDGVVYMKHGDEWKKTTKPRPADIDEWTHYLHDATGNPVAQDQVVGPPRHLQWIGSPRWSRHHDRMASMSALVSAGGRIFTIQDEGSRVSIQLPPRWTVQGRDAFNGTVLWKRRMADWFSHLWPLKSGPTQLARRLVATDSVVYVTLGFRAPTSVLDAATGKTLRTIEGSQSTEEIIASGAKVFLLVNKGVSELANYAPKLNVGDQRRVANEFLWNEKPRRIVAADAATGKLRWQMDTVVSPLTLAAGREHVFYHDGQKVVALDRITGNMAWQSMPVSRRGSYTMNFGPRLVVYEKLVLFAGGDRSMRALSAATGKELWSAQHPRSGYQSPEDLIVAGGLLWSAPTTGSRDSGIYTGRDPYSGEVKVEFAPNVNTYWFHHRCHLAKATERFLLPSRTGIEFVDFRKKDWNINHWVRGGCLYGIMPCNGLIYAPPHNCACYPEAKLYGFNALAPASQSRSVGAVDESTRLERGPAWGETIAGASHPGDWPTYRHDRARSGSTPLAVEGTLTNAWRRSLGGRLSSIAVAEGRLFVAQVDAHTLHALDAKSGASLWEWTAGARIDSPPTVDRGRVYFGSADGSVYSLRADNGKLIWRFRVAPRDLRLMAFEQLESVWPVHGSVLIQDGAVYAVAGRSNFLDGGLRFVKLDAKTGEKLAESVINERDPETGENVQARLKVLNMTAGLPDILSSDGKWVFMRSQRLSLKGERQELGPVSGQPAEQGAAQHGVGAHLFAPMGFLDDTWFHRAYWVFGRAFAGGHAGYYQAGKYAPSGRILVFDDDNVYGFGRKPEYYRWTTTLEHQLFSASKTPPEVVAPSRRGPAMVRFAKSPSLDPTGKTMVVEAWVKAEKGKPNGVIVARGGPARGYALYVQKGRPTFSVRDKNGLVSAVASAPLRPEWTHLVGQLTPAKELKIYVNGKLAGSAKNAELITADPAQSLEIGGDDVSSVGTYRAPFAWAGTIDEVRVYYGQLSDAEILERVENLGRAPAKNAELVLSCSFDDADGKDASDKKNHGTVMGARTTKGRIGNALKFTGGRGGGRAAGSFVKPRWAGGIPMLARAMVLAKKTLFVAGAPDLVDEEKSFERIVARDSAIEAKLAEQEAALDGKVGSHLWAVAADTGKPIAQYRIPSLPVWDGMVAANGRLYISSIDGAVMCLAGR